MIGSRLVHRMIGGKVTLQNSAGTCWHVLVRTRNNNAIAPHLTPINQALQFGSSTSSDTDGTDTSVDKLKQQPQRTSSPTDWRKSTLEKIKSKFEEPSQTIENQEDLQPMWRDMESRVTRRRPRTLADTGGKTGRVNVKRTDEEFWLLEGLYDDKDDDNPSSGKNK